MSVLTFVLIAIGLAMDAFAVSIQYGLSCCDMALKNKLRIAAFFGGFQAAMPLLGWLVGSSLRSFISSIDHWVALIILTGVGGKMIYEALQPAENRSVLDSLALKTLFMLALATSIDALAVGVTFAFLDLDVLTASSFIGIITFALSLIAVNIGCQMGPLFERKAEIAGGVILILIGLKIFLFY